jgi:hypothetical protein
MQDGKQTLYALGFVCLIHTSNRPRVGAGGIIIVARRAIQPLPQEKISYSIPLYAFIQHRYSMYHYG